VYVWYIVQDNFDITVNYMYVLLNHLFLFGPFIGKWTFSCKTRNATMRQNQVFNDSTKYWYDRNKKWKMAVKKKMLLFWLHWLHAPSLVSIGQSKLKLLSGNWISFLVTVTLTLITDTWVAIPRCVLMWATHKPSLVSIGQSKLKLLSSNLSLTPFRIRPPDRPPNRPPFTNLITRIFVENLVKKQQKKISLIIPNMTML